MPGLSARVKRARDLRAPEGAIGEQAAVFARERHALLDALVDDEIAHFREAINVRFARAKIAALDGVVEKPVNAVAVVRVIFRGVDPALRGDAVRAAGAVLVAERFNVVALLSQRRGGGATGQTGADDDDFVAPAIVRRDESGIVLMAPPFLWQGAVGSLRIRASRS